MRRYKARDDHSEDDTPPHSREVERYIWRGREHFEEYNNFSPKVDVLEFESKLSVNDFLDY